MHQNRKSSQPKSSHLAKLKNQTPTANKHSMGMSRRHFNFAFRHKSNSRKSMGKKWKVNSNNWCHGGIFMGSSANAETKITI